MKNMLSYLKVHKYDTFDVLPFNDIDSLILSQISYLNIENVIKSYSKINSLIIWDNWRILCDKTMTYRGNKKMCRMFSDNTRYKDIFVVDYEVIASDDNNTQFFAVTYYLNDFLYVAFRGTDLTIYGWREDFDMLYERTPSQIAAVNYLNFISDKFHRPIIVGGHSKGGNLALYGAMYAKEETKKRIIKIYNFDGPGFYDKKIYETEEFKNASKKLFSITSRVSVVSMLLYKIPGVRFIEVRSVSVLTHDAFNWSVDVDKCKFKFVEKNSNLSRWLDAASDQYMEETTPFGRKNIVEITFKILKESPTMSLVDVVHHPILYIKRFRVRHKALSKDENNILENEIKKIRKILKISFKNSIIGKNNDIENNNKLLKGDKDE